MDRMSFVPGADARIQIEECGGRIFFGRKAAIDYGDTFIFPSGQNILFQTSMVALSEGDEIEITFDLWEAEDEGEDVEDAGSTKATFTDQTTGKTKVLWEVGDKDVGLSDQQIGRAYNAYHRAMAAHLGVPPSDAQGSNALITSGSSSSVSCALSPSNILLASGGMWYFVELSAVPTSSPEYSTAHAVLTRPMRAFDALVLTSIITLAFGSPPLVFGIRPGRGMFGKLPQNFERLKLPRRYETPENETPDVYVCG